MALFDGLTIIGLFGAAKQIFKEATTYKPAANERIDWQKVDEESYLSAEEKQRRWRRGYYHTSEPMKMFDLQMYKDDILAGATVDELEANRLAGKYGAVKPYGYDSKANYSTKELTRPYVVDVEKYEYKRRKHPDWYPPNRLFDFDCTTLDSPSCWKQYL